MRKRVFGRQLKRDTNERKALFKNLVSSLVLFEDIETTQAKAKAVRGLIDKLVTKAKRGKSNVSANLSLYLNKQALEKFVSDIVPRFNDRTSGFTRMIRVRNRLSDNAPMVLVRWVEKAVPVESEKRKVESSKQETTAEVKRQQPQAEKGA